jgi:hypothetical protein
VPIAVTLNNALDFVQQAAGLADIFNEISLFPEMLWRSPSAQKPDGLWLASPSDLSQQFYYHFKYASEMRHHVMGLSNHAMRMQAGVLGTSQYKNVP